MIYRVLERFLRDYLKARDFGPTPFKQLFLVLWTVFTYKGTTRRQLTFAMVTVAMTSVFVRFKLVKSLSDANYGDLVSVVLWACLFYSSAYLVYLYLTTLRSNYSTQKLVWHIRSDTKRLVIVGSCLGFLQLISGLILVWEMAVQYRGISAASYTVLPIIVYWTMRLIIHAMEGILLVTVYPLQMTWLSYATTPTKQYVVQLTPMIYYNITLNYILTSLLGNTDNLIPTNLSLLYFAYFFLKLSWLTALSIQVANKSLLPVIYQPEGECIEGDGDGVAVWQPIGSRTQMIPGVNREHVLEGLAEKSLVVCGTRMRSETLHRPRLTKTPIIKDSFMNESLLHTGYTSVVPREQRFVTSNKTLLYSKSNGNEPANEDSVKNKPRMHSIEDLINTDDHAHKCNPDCDHEIVERDSPSVSTLTEFRVADDYSVTGSASTLSAFDKQQSLLGNTGSSSRQRTSHRGNQ